MIKIILAVILSLSSPSLLAKYDLRKCFVLPVTGDYDQERRIEIFDKVEKYLKEANWCRLKPASGLLDILSKHKSSVAEGFEKSEILALIAEKSKAGSLIKISLKPEKSNLLAKLAVVGENGSDIYFSEEKVFFKEEMDSLFSKIISWLEKYEKSIPFQGQIEELKGKDFSTDMGTSTGLEEGVIVRLVKPLAPQKHPLLNEVVDWQMQDLGVGKIIESTKEGARGEIKKGTGIDPGDWVILSLENEVIEKEPYPKYGYFSIAIDLGSAEQDVQDFGYSNNYQGSMLGAYLKGELWLLENIWLSLELDGRQGDLTSDYAASDFESRTFLKIKVGYRFLLSESFFGSQIDLYMGYGIYSYSPEQITYQGPYDATFKGLILGVRGNFAIGEKFRSWLEGEVIFASGTVNDSTGGQVPGYSLFLGGNYFFHPKLSLDLTLGTYNNTFENILPGQNVYYTDYSLRLGPSIYF